MNISKSTLLILLLICQQVLSQSIRPEILNIVNEISNYGKLTSESIGYSGKQSQQFQRSMLLDSLAIKEELVVLVEHKSPVVRCAAFPALCNKDTEIATQVLLKHLSDTEKIHVQYGCVGNDSTVADDFISSYIYILVEKDTVISEKNQAYKRDLDKLLLESPTISLRYKSNLIKTLEKNEINYNIVRKIAIEGNEPESISALAKYHNSKDKSIIINALKETNLQTAAIRAVKEFPLKKFYPYITEIFKDELLKSEHDYPKVRLLYQTLAQYPNEAETLILFDKTFTFDTVATKTLKEYLWMAITKYPNSKFEIYKSKLNVDENNFFLLEERDID